MGLEVLVPLTDPPPRAAVLARLAASGFPSTIMMVDGALVPPQAPPPATFRDVRLRTPAGTVTVTRRPDGFAVLVFGNAGPAEIDAQRRVADALRATDG